MTASLLVFGLALFIPQHVQAHSGCDANNGRALLGRFDVNNDGVLSHSERKRARKKIQRILNRNRGLTNNPYNYAAVRNQAGGWHGALLNGQNLVSQPVGWQAALQNARNILNQPGGWHGALLNGGNVYSQPGGWHAALLNGQTTWPQLSGLPVNYQNGALIDVDGDGQINQHERMYSQLLAEQARRNR